VCSPGCGRIDCGETRQKDVSIVDHFVTSDSFDLFTVNQMKSVGSVLDLEIYLERDLLKIKTRTVKAMSSCFASLRQICNIRRTYCVHTFCAQITRRRTGVVATEQRQINGSPILN
jgi:hypothetical protein